MEGPLRGILAGAAAWKFGGGCISTILIFIIVFWLLGYDPLLSHKEAQEAQDSNPTSLVRLVPLCGFLPTNDQFFGFLPNRKIRANRAAMQLLRLRQQCAGADHDRRDRIFRHRRA